MSPVPTEPHHAVQTVHQRATTVIDYQAAASHDSFWRRWFDRPAERQLADEVRAFISALDYVLDVPPTMVSRRELVAIGQDVDRVIARIEAEISAESTASPDTAAALTPAIYVIRNRYEELYKRGGTKPE